MNNEIFEELAEMLMSEGVKEEDWLWWQRLTVKEKEEIKEADASFRSSFLVQCAEEGMSEMEALLKMMRVFAFYEEYPPRPEILNLTMKLGLTDEDKALPYELHGRIDNFFRRVAQNESEIKVFQEEVRQHPSLNACLRYKIKNREI